MKLEQTCTQCGGSGTKLVEIKEGDILLPRDGSGMPTGLHHLLWKGQGEGFKPVKVIQVEGNVLAVTPLGWDDSGIRYLERRDAKATPAISWIPGHDIFWIYAPYCNLVVYTKESHKS